MISKKQHDLVILAESIYRGYVDHVYWDHRSRVVEVIACSAASGCSVRQYYHISSVFTLVFCT
jgi:hypothetical protein